MDINAKIEVDVPLVRGKPRTVYAVDGLSAYEIAVKHGFEGTEEAWLNSIVRGDPGKTPVLGVDYFDGKDGLSAYEIAVKNGFEGTEKEWLDSVVVGKDGKDGKTPYIKDGYWWIGDTNTNVKAEGTNGKDGENSGTFHNDEIPFDKDNPIPGEPFVTRVGEYPVDLTIYKKGNIYSRQWNNADGTKRKGTALFKYEGTNGIEYSFTLISLIYDGEGGGINFTTDETLTLSEDDVLKVKTASKVTKDGNLPVTAGAVYDHINNTLGEINTILEKL